MGQRPLSTPPPAEGQQPPPKKGRWAALAAALMVLFGAAMAGTIGGQILMLAVVSVLVGHGVSRPLAVFLAGFAGTSMPLRQSPFPPGPAVKATLADAPFYRAWYVANAVRRLERAGDSEAARAKESLWFRWHLAAMSNRLARAEQVDMAAASVASVGPSGHRMLGWQAVIDNSTTPECRAANGKNFRADRPPVIGWPGSVHPKCRCRAVAPFRGAPTIPSR